MAALARVSTGRCATTKLGQRQDRINRESLRPAGVSTFRRPVQDERSNGCMLVRCDAAPPGDGGTRSGPSYLDMWKEAQERRQREQQQSAHMERLAAEAAEREQLERSPEMKQRREQAFFQLLEVPEEERRKVEQQQLVDRAAAALAAAQNLLADAEEKERLERQLARGRSVSEPPRKSSSLSFTGKPKSRSSSSYGSSPDSSSQQNGNTQSGARRVATWTPSGGGAGGSGSYSGAGSSSAGSTKGPDFWSWVPPEKTGSAPTTASMPPEFRLARETARAKPAMSVLEMERPSATFDLPLQTAGMEASAVAAIESLKSVGDALNLPFQSSIQAFQIMEPSLAEELESTTREAISQERSILLESAVEVRRMQATQRKSKNQTEPEETEGVMPDGSRWWRSTGRETKPNGEVCEWTVVRGVSADGSVEWEEKWWETWDAFDYKELGAEKSGRNADGGVWRECWQEAMWQDKSNGLPHIEKSADKWGKDGKGGEWHEKWWEHYDGMGRAEKWADKWSKIDPYTPLDDGHAHVWHERWGEEFDGAGAASKYCDKWAERCLNVDEGVWTKWGDKWDENFNRDAHGYKQGETWWEGPGGGERWNRTWSEGHNGSGWVHKQGQSSSGEYWDVHEPMDTWYERKAPHGFKEAMEQSGRLQRVGKKKRVL